MEELRGYVQQIIYRNEDSGYAVFVLNEEGEEITCTGTAPGIAEGESCRVSGEYTQHPVYGRQFHCREYSACPPQGKEAVYRYLASGAVKGIRKSLAARIVKEFGDDTMRILDEEPERLSEVKGISPRMAKEISAQMEDKKDLRDAMIFLQKYGIGGAQAMKIWDRYHMELYRVLKENPYRLSQDIDGIGFLTADSIAQRAGIAADSDFRIRSGILYILSLALGEGNCYLPENILTERAASLLHVDPEQVKIQTENLAMDRKIRARTLPDSSAQIFLQSTYRTEQEAAKMLLDIDAAAPAAASRQEAEASLKKIEEAEGIVLDDLQKEAALRAVTEGVLIITGGPGTGKTTAIRTIIRYFISNARSVSLAAPTGRAAKRMSEATGYEAMTIHRLLGCRTTGKEGAVRNDSEDFFEHDSDNPLDTDVIIIDEMSMVDIFLFHALLLAVKKGTRLIMVGDVNQLPSVGPGRVLGDIINSGRFSCVVLEKIFRQAAKSDIVMNAHRILRGEELIMDNRSRDFFFLERSDVNVIYKHIVVLITQMLPKYVGCTWQEIQVLTPQKKGLLGTEKLNEVLQSVLNPPSGEKKEHAFGDLVFREGDKVMQTRNNYQLAWEVPGNFNIPLESGTGVFNGDCGQITEISDVLSQMTVRFDDGRVAVYSYSELGDLEMAYAVTVHKSQGSEYPAVILPLLSGPSRLFSRSLLYTALTRAKKCAVILGSRECVRRMAANRTQTERYTGLRDRIDEIAGSGDLKEGGGLPLSEEVPGM